LCENGELQKYNNAYKKEKNIVDSIILASIVERDNKDEYRLLSPTAIPSIRHGRMCPTEENRTSNFAMWRLCEPLFSHPR